MSVGAGHLRAAEAVAACIRRDYPHHIVVELDVLDKMPKPFRKLYRDLYLDLVNRAPRLFGWLYDQTDRPFEKDLLRQTFERANAGEFFDFVKDSNFDLAICTHFLPSSLLYNRRRKGTFQAPIATVVTDFDIHGMWLATPSDRLFVATEEAAEYLFSFGVEKERVFVTGVPTHPRFQVRHDRQILAPELGLRAELPTLLVSAGGFGVGNLHEILQPLLECQTPLQMVVVCGRNAELREQLAQKYSRENWHFLGFTDKFDLYMECCDLLVGKPGGLTTWESFVKGVGWVVVNPIPGQEERNTYHLLEKGVGVWAYEPRTLRYKIENLLRDPGRLERMRSSSLALARPDAASQILLALLGQPDTVQ